jgi:hypothetical protein
MSRDTTVIPFRQPDAIDDPLSEVAREGARRMLAQVLIAEADAFVAQWKDVKLPDGRDRVVRHGHGPQRRNGAERFGATGLEVLDNWADRRGVAIGLGFHGVDPETPEPIHVGIAQPCAADLCGGEARLGPPRDQGAFLLGEGGEQVEHERVGIGAQLAHDEGDTVRHETGNEMHVAATPTPRRAGARR